MQTQLRRVPSLITKGQTMNKLFLTAALLATGTSVLAPAHAASKSAASTLAQPLPQYVSLETLKKWQKQNDPRKMPIALQPLMDGKSLKGQDRRDLITDPPLIVMKARAGEDGNAVEVGAEADAAVADTNTNPDASTPAATETGMNGARLAQGPPIPAPLAPARPRPRAPRTVTPRWVRYPLEFQLCGVGLGMKAVDKDRFNRIDRYGLFAIHGNPTAIVVPTAGGGSVTVNQQPPEVASFFADDPGAGLPNWASAITVQLDNNHVEWLYRRDTYAMGFVVDRLGYVDAIVVAGVYSPIARTQLEDPVHTVKLGDDLRKVLFRYGYPDTIETYLINAAAGVAVTAPTAAGAEAGAGAAAGGEPPLPAQPGGAGAAAGAGAAGATAGGAANAAFRTFEVRYEQSYNVVFTIRNNRVVRVYIFGDPDFFNEQRRNAIRRQY
jgi:hypothetical protein